MKAGNFMVKDNEVTSSDMPLWGWVTVVGTPAVMGEIPGLSYLRAARALVETGAVIDDRVDLFCRKCDLRMRCEGPPECARDPEVLGKLRSGRTKIVSCSPDFDRRRMSDLFDEFEHHAVAAEMDSVKNPPATEAEIQRYREEVMWPWAQFTVGLREGSTIRVISSEAHKLPASSAGEGRLIEGVFYAGCHFQVKSDFNKHKYNVQNGLPCYGLTIDDADERRCYCDGLARYYAERSVKYGTNPLVFRLFGGGFSAIHAIRRRLPKGLRSSSFFVS